MTKKEYIQPTVYVHHIEAQRVLMVVSGNRIGIYSEEEADEDDIL